MLEAFEQGAGFTPAALSLLIRVMFYGAAFIWGVWAIHGEWQLWAGGEGDGAQLFRGVATLLVFLLFLGLYLS